MAKAKKKRSAADAPLPDPKSGSSPRVAKKKGAASVQKGKSLRSATRPVCEKCGQIHKRCTAHNKAGGPCGQQARRGSSTCRNHGGNAPQVRKAANERLVAMVIPALAQLERVLTKPDTSDADRIKAALAILNRTGYNERHQVDIGLREPSPWDGLTDTAVRIVRGVESVTDEEPDALPSGGGADEEALQAFLEHRARRRQQEAQTHLDNSGHDVVPASTASEDNSRPTTHAAMLTSDDDLFGFPKTQAQRYRESGATELDPDGTRPVEESWAEYERRVREAPE